MATPQMQCYNPAVGKASPGYNVAQAKQILAQTEAGVQKGLIVLVGAL